MPSPGAEEGRVSFVHGGESRGALKSCVRRLSMLVWRAAVALCGHDVPQVTGECHVPSHDMVDTTVGPGLGTTPHAGWKRHVETRRAAKPTQGAPEPHFA